jgi:hypothetical protein
LVENCFSDRALNKGMRYSEFSDSAERQRRRKADAEKLELETKVRDQQRGEAADAAKTYSRMKKKADLTGAKIGHWMARFDAARKAP